MPAHVEHPRGQAEQQARRAAHGLTPVRRRVLEWLAEHPGAAIMEIGASLSRTKHAIHLNVVALKTLGLVTYDRNKSRDFRLTEAGWAALGRTPRCATCGQALPLAATKSAATKTGGTDG